MDATICKKSKEVKEILESRGLKRWHIFVSYGVRVGDDLDTYESGGFPYFIYGSIDDAIEATKTVWESIFKGLPEECKGGGSALITEPPNPSLISRVWDGNPHCGKELYMIEYSIPPGSPKIKQL